MNNYNPREVGYYLHLAICPEPEGGFSVIVTNLDGAGSQGETIQEAIDNAKEAALGVIESYLAAGEEIPWNTTSHIPIPGWMCVGVDMSCYPKEQKPMNDIAIVYKNWKGEIGERVISPRLIYWGSTEHHKEKQWLIEAFCHLRADTRTFALRDIIAVSAGPGEPMVEIKQSSLGWLVELLLTCGQLEPVLSEVRVLKNNIKQLEANCEIQEKRLDFADDVIDELQGIIQDYYNDRGYTRDEE